VSSGRCGSRPARRVTAWVYLYQKDVSQLTLITDGLWIASPALALDTNEAKGLSSQCLSPGSIQPIAPAPADLTDSG